MSATDEPIGLNVILIPSDEVVSRACAFSAACQKHGTSSVLLNDRDMLTHLTIHQCPVVGGVPALKLGLLKMVLENELAGTGWQKDTGLTVKMEHRFKTFLNTGLFWNAHLGLELQRLHLAVVDTMNKLRQSYILPHHAPMLCEPNLVSAQQRASLSAWGSPLARGQYLPHITIGNMSDASEAEAAIEGLRNSDISGDISFVAREIAIAGIGPFGTCPQIFERISLV